MKILLILSVMITSILSVAAEDDVAVLDTVISDGTPAESLKYDPIIPAYMGKTQPKIGQNPRGGCRPETLIRISRTIFLFTRAEVYAPVTNLDS